MNLSNDSLIPALLSSVAFGFADHFYCHHYQPNGVLLPLFLVAIQPTPILLFWNLPLSFWNIILICWACVSTLLTSIALYRLSPWHPLANVPGPALFKVSKLWGAWICWRGSQHIINKELHDIYGPVVRTGPDEISMIEAEAVPAVLGASGLPKGNYYFARHDPSAPANLLSMNGEAHANRRRLWNRGMGTAALYEYHDIISKRATQLLEELSSRQGVVNIVDWLNYFTTDVMGDMAFGGGFEMLATGDADGFWTAVHEFTRWTAVICHIPWATRLAQTIPFISDLVLSIRKACTHCAMNRAKAGSVTKDLWYYLTDDAGFEKEKPSLRDVAADGTLAVVAGADTTSSALACLFYFLLNSKEDYLKLQLEIDTVFADGESPFSVQKHSELSFLSACINETLRLCPPVPTGGPRQVPLEGPPRLIAGHLVPPGTQIYVPPYARHRNPEYFPNPDQFIPERWLDDTSDSQSDAGSDSSMVTKRAFAPFSYGPANCVGKRLAKQEMLMCMSALMQKFDFSFAPGFDSRDWLGGVHDYFVTARDPMMVTLTARN